MVARVFAPSHLTIDAGDSETFRQGRAEQKMIDAQTGIASKGVPEILPERVDSLAWVQSPQGVGPALLHKAAICVPYLGPEQRVINPAFRRVDIEIGRHDVVIACEYDRLPGRQQAIGMLCQPIEPAQLVIELRSRSGIAVWQIEASDDHAVDRRFDVAAVRIVRIARQAPADFHRLGGPRQDRHAVPAFLPMPDRAITGSPDSGFRKPRIWGL